jgi:hypothetical protein
MNQTAPEYKGFERRSKSGGSLFDEGGDAPALKDNALDRHSKQHRADEDQG